MIPVLFTIGNFKFYTYGLFLVLGFFWGFFLLWKLIRLTAYKEEEVFDGLFLSLFFGLLISRLIYVLLNFSKFGFDFLKFILINGYPGLSLFGFLAGFFISFFWFCQSRKIKYFDLIDYYITPLLVVLGFIKIGSFFSGTEVGTVTQFFLKTRYIGYEGLRHLVGLYQGLLIFAISAISYRIIFETRKEKFRSGFLFFFFFWSLSIVILLFDKIKVNSLYLQGKSFDRLVSIILLLTTSGYFVYYFKNQIVSFIKYYGQKIVKRFHRSAKKDTRTGKEKKPSTD